MIDGPALLVDRFGALVSSAVHSWMPSLGRAADAVPIRLTAAVGLVVVACFAAWVLFALMQRLIRVIPQPWQDAMRSGLPSWRLMTAAVLLLLSVAPFLWTVHHGTTTALAGAVPLDADAQARVVSLPAMIATWLTAALLIIAGGNLLFRLVQALGAIAVERSRHTKSAWDDVLLEVGTRVVLGFIILGTIYVAIAVLADHPVLTETTAHLLGLLVIALITWALINVVHLVDRFLMTRYHTGPNADLQARRITTQVVVLKRLAYLLITVFAVSMALMQFEAIRHIGTSILASAGLAGIVLGFAAQRTLGNVLAGMQIALTQPLRIDDSVIIEKEFGKVEEITLTYVVLALWDGRRLIVPLSRVIENPFENWTRNSTELLGTVLLRCSFGVPIDELRAEAKRFVEAHRLWDKRVFAVQMTDSDHRSIEVRVLVSAAAGGPLFDLRCEVREHLLKWLNEHHPEAIPRVVLSQPDDHSEHRPSARVLTGMP